MLQNTVCGKKPNSLQSNSLLRLPAELTELAAFTALEVVPRGPLLEQGEAGVKERGDLVLGCAVRWSLGRGGIHVKDPEVVSAGLECQRDRAHVIRAVRRWDRAEAGMFHYPVEAAVP